jgi:hypothetical protein
VRLRGGLQPGDPGVGLDDRGRGDGAVGRGHSRPLCLREREILGGLEQLGLSLMQRFAQEF